MRTPLLLAACLPCILSGCGEGETAKVDRTQAQVEQLADEFDRLTDDVGRYKEAKTRDLKETDAFGRVLRVEYSKGGVGEALTVRSLGPDGKSHTDDDITATRQAVNLGGVGVGIKQNAGDVAADIAAGAVKGTAAGVKQVSQDAAAAGRGALGKAQDKLKEKFGRDKASDPESDTETEPTPDADENS